MHYRVGTARKSKQACAAISGLSAASVTVRSVSYLPDVDSSDYDWISRPRTTPAASLRPRPEWDRWLDMIAQVGGDRGRAIAGLSRLLGDRLGMSSLNESMSSTEFAIELLEADSDETCAVVAALIEDGWAEGTGKLLACARSLTGRPGHSNA